MEFDLPKGSSSIIKVIGVGGGGSNAVNHMFEQGIKGVDFVVCNTDRQALDISPVPYKIQLGPSLTEGRGAGAIPEVGRNAAVENQAEIEALLKDNTKMIFVTAGMGGGTGTGAAPVIAAIAKSLNILTVGIVTVPFEFEGRRRRQQAEEGLEEMRKNVDTLLIINNERLREYGGNMAISQCFGMADNVLTTAAKGIAEVISVTGMINIDFNDVNTVMRNSGVAIMGSAAAEGEDRALVAVKEALNSPLLNDNDIEGAKQVLLNITYGDVEVRMDEIGTITDYIQEAAGSTAEVNWGHGYDASLGNKLSVTLVATGFHSSPITGLEKAPEKQVKSLEETAQNEIKEPLSSPTDLPKMEAKIVEEPKAETFVTPLPTVAPVVEEKTVEPIVHTLQTETKEEITVDLSKEEAPEIEFEVSSPVTSVVEEKKVVNVLRLDEDKTELNERTAALSQEEMNRKNQARIDSIQSLSQKMKKAEGIKELEEEPAYLRKGINLSLSKLSSSSSQSRFGLGSKGDGLSSNNSFLHDNVD